ALLGRGIVSEAAARFTLRINFESRLASFCILASSFSSFLPKLFSVIIGILLLFDARLKTAVGMVRLAGKGRSRNAFFGTASKAAQLRALNRLKRYFSN